MPEALPGLLPLDDRAAGRSDWLMIESPCIKLCILNPAGDHCVGCGRSLAEIGGWTGFSDGERARVIADLPRRLIGMRERPLAGVEKLDS